MSVNCQGLLHIRMCIFEKSMLYQMYVARFFNLTFTLKIETRTSYVTH